MSYNNENENYENAQTQSPFADTVTLHPFKENFAIAEPVSSESFSPFANVADGSMQNATLHPQHEQMLEFLGELHDEHFNEVLYNVAGELSEFSDATPGLQHMEFEGQPVNLGQQTYINRLTDASNAMIDKVREHFGDDNMPTHRSEAEMEQMFENMAFEHHDFSPVQEQFFGKIFNAVKNVAKAGFNLLKKGIAFAGKIFPIGFLLNKLKAMIKPLLKKVLKFAVGKLPAAVRPWGQKLADKLFGHEDSSHENETPAAAEVDAIQHEFNHHLTGLTFASSENEAEQYVSNYAAEPNQSNEELADVNAARKQFINELKQLQPGESPQPAIEKFLPALMALQPVIKIVIGIIGRQKIVNFLGKLLNGLIKKFVPEQVAMPLSTGIVDVGMRAIGFETNEHQKTDLAYEALANTLEEAVSRTDFSKLAVEPSNEHFEEVQHELYQSFEHAAANNFPNQMIRPELHTSTHNGVWVLMPRHSNGHYGYKKFSHIFDVKLDAAKLHKLKTFRHLPVANFLQDKYGLTLQKHIHARIHVYEAIPGTSLKKISMHEHVHGLKTASKAGWNMFHPLNKLAAAALLGEPSMGRNFSSRYTASHFRVALGQRFYYIEIPGAQLRLPVTNHHDHWHLNHHNSNTSPDNGTLQPTGNLHRPSVTQPVASSGDVHAVVNFPKSEIRLDYYLSEEDVIKISAKLRSSDFAGAAGSLRHAIHRVLHEMLHEHVGSKVKIIHEAVAELYLENERGLYHTSPTHAKILPVGSASHSSYHHSNGATPQSAHGFLMQSAHLPAGISAGFATDMLKNVMRKVVHHISEASISGIQNHFNEKASEFIHAHGHNKDGLTIRVTFTNVPGMSALRKVIAAIRGNSPLGALTEFGLGSIPKPTVTILSGKRFS